MDEKPRPLPRRHGLAVQGHDDDAAAGPTGGFTDQLNTTVRLRHFDG
jgi:hypothetical protein